MAKSGLKLTKQTAAGFAISSMVFLMMYLALFNLASQQGAGIELGGVALIPIFNVLLLLPNYFCFSRLGWVSFWEHISVGVSTGVVTSLLIFSLVSLFAKGESWELLFVLGATVVFFQVSVAVFWFTAIRGRDES